MSGGPNCLAPQQPQAGTCGPRLWRDGHGPWDHGKRHCFASGVDTAQLTGPYPRQRERTLRPRAMLTGRVPQGHGGTQPLPASSPRARRGSPQCLAILSWSGLGVRRALNLACLNQHRPGLEPHLPLTSDLYPPHPHPLGLAPVLLAVSLFFPGLSARWY